MLQSTPCVVVIDGGMQQMQRGPISSAGPHAGVVCEPLKSTSCTRPAPRACICASTAGNSEAGDGCARMPFCFVAAGWTSTDGRRPAERRAGCHLHSCTAATALDAPDVSCASADSRAVIRQVAQQLQAMQPAKMWRHLMPMARPPQPS